MLGAHLHKIQEYAAAADGGSLAFEGAHDDGSIRWYMVNRSIAARGTPQYNCITCAGRQLTDSERTALIAQIKSLLPTVDAELGSFLSSFIA
jgi:hypothetical protein